MSIVNDLRKIVYIISEMIDVRKDIIRFLDRVSMFEISVQCRGGVAIRCSIGFCDIIDTSTRDKVTIFKNEVVLAPRDSRRAYGINPEKTRSPKAKRILEMAESCREEIENAVKEMETRLERLRQILALLSLVDTS